MMGFNRTFVITTLLTLSLISRSVFVSADSNVNDASSEETGVSNFLDKLEGVVETKTLWFYRYFGQNLNRNKIVGATAENSCDYDDPVKIKFCPPAPKAPLHVAHRTQKKGASAEAQDKADGKGEDKDDEMVGISPLTLTKCLDNPSDPDCVRLLQDDSVAAGQTTPQRRTQTTFTTSMPTGTSEGLATQEPTRDDCYGNMLDGRFCTSEMPSISEEPTVIAQPGSSIPPGETGFTPSDSTSLTYSNGTQVGTCMIDVHNVDNSPAAAYGMPLSLVRSTGDTVTFTLEQTWKHSTVDYIHTVYIVPPGGEQRACDSIEQVPFGQPKKE